MTCLHLVVVLSMRAGLLGLLGVPLSARAADPVVVVRGAPMVPVVPVPSPLRVPSPAPVVAPSPIAQWLAACPPGSAREVDGRCLRHDLPGMACGPDGQCLVAPPDFLPYGQGPALRRAY